MSLNPEHADKRAASFLMQFPPHIMVSQAREQELERPLTPIEWSSIMEGDKGDVSSQQRVSMLSLEELALLKQYEKSSEKDQRLIWDEGLGNEMSLLLIDLLRRFEKDERKCRYLLKIIFDCLKQEPLRAVYFHNVVSNDRELYEPLINLLDNKELCGVANMILNFLIRTAGGDSSMQPAEFEKYCSWLTAQLRLRNHPCEAMNSIGALLRHSDSRKCFFKKGGLDLIAKILASGTKNGQLLYESIFCLWLVSFEKSLVNTFGPQKTLIQALIEITRVHTKEKILRVALATLRNLSSSKLHCELLVEEEFVPLLNSLHKRKWEDEDVIEDIEYLQVTLKDYVHELTTFEVYLKELQSGYLKWGPVHSSAEFWAMHAEEIEADNFKIINDLLEILKTSPDAVSIAVAAHDLGEYAQNAPGGRRILNHKVLGVKAALLTLVSHPNDRVAREALGSLQKIMISNYEAIKSL
eukprot:GCRY01002492.1.p1 GENE.GCRY01002492.1~~GCRY01002492.1.p1  ORF type:complete len:468 (+),score=85.53 GCRY01002492.1:165-1568(+)